MSSSNASVPVRTSRTLPSFIGYLACFALPIALLALLCAIRGVYPFGGESFLSGDLRYQYVDFFVWFRSLLLGQDGNLMFSFAQGMGVGTWGLYSFYLASPLNLFVVFFDDAHIVLFIWLIVAVKLGLAEMSMVFFLRRRFQINGPIAAMFGLAVVFGTWTASNLRSPMWLDNLILLPLICWAAYRFINHGRWRLLVALLAASVIICWYTAYMTIFFLVFYAVLEQMALAARTGTRFRDNNLWRKVLGMAGCGVLALFLSMWTFLPTIQAQSASQGAMSSRVRGYVAQAQQLAGGLVKRFLPVMLVFGALVVLAIIAVIALVVVRRRARRARSADAEAVTTPRTYVHTVAWRICVAIFAAGSAVLAIALARIPALAHIWELGTRTDLKGLLLGFTPTAWQEEQIPQLFAGAVVTVLAIVFFLLPSIALSVRKTAAVILVFTLASTWLIPLEMLWCGLRYPKGFYSRPAIYAVFLMVLLASAACRELFAGRLPWKRDARGSVVGPVTQPSIAGAAAVTGADGGVAADAVIATDTAGTAVAGTDTGTVAGPGDRTVDGTGMRTGDDATAAGSSIGSGAGARIGIGISTGWTRALTALIVVLTIPEFIIAANHTFSVVYRDYPQAHATAYSANSRAQAQRLAELDDGVYRFEKNYTRANLGALNEGMASGFRQLSIYSSANSAAAVDFLAALGYSQTDENLTRYAALSLLSDSLLGVKYVSLGGLSGDVAGSGDTGSDGAASDGAGSSDSSRNASGSSAQSVSGRSQYLGMTRVLDAAGVGAEAVYRNPNALPLAYGVPASVAGSAMPKSGDPFENQNAFASALVGHAVSPFKQVEAKAVDNPDGTRTWTIQVPEGSVGYVYVSTQATVDFGLSIDGSAPITENNRFEHALHPLAGETSGVTGDVDVDAGAETDTAGNGESASDQGDTEREAADQGDASHGTADSESADVQSGDTGASRGGSVGVGTDEYAGGTHTVTLSSPTGAPVTGDQPAATCMFAVLDMSEVQSITRQLAQNPLNIEQFEDGHIRGTFEAGDGAAGDDAGSSDSTDTGVGVAGDAGADSADSSASTHSGSSSGSSSGAGSSSGVGSSSGASSGSSVGSDSGSSVDAESGVAAQSLLVTTPYSKGWQVTVNGVKVAAQPAFGGAATVIPVQPGHNTIDMRFITPGLVPGAVVSAVTTLGCVGAATIVAVRRKHGQRRP